MRITAIIGAIKHGVFPWWMYEKVKHYECSYWQHLIINIRYAWRWATFNELQSDIDFENSHKNPPTQLNREEMITPQEAKEKKLEGIDHAMIRAFDEMIVHNYRHDSKEARVPQKEVIARYFKIKGVEETSKAKQLLFDNGWLDVEPLYRKAGWKVEYDKPGYNESYEAFFIFSH